MAPFLGASSRGASMAWRRPLSTTLSSFCQRRDFFVRFQPTPNEACYKFFVDGVQFLPGGAHTMMFDRDNAYQSPIANGILHALPMVEEVTVGPAFVTVKRVEEVNAEAAARYFAMRFQGTTPQGRPASSVEGQSSEADAEAEAAARSQALQQHVYDVMESEETAAAAANAGEATSSTAMDVQRKGAGTPGSEAADGPPAAHRETPPQGEPYFRAGGSGPESFEMGGFAVQPGSTKDEELDEAAIRQLIEAMSWSDLKLHVCALLTDHMYSGEPHVSPDAPHPHSDTQPQDGDSDVVLMIKELIASTVRPELQDDGGDIRFVRFCADSGTMEVELLGACRTCKSSKTTLVDLIERTTRHWIPEVVTVLEVGRKASAFEEFVAAAAARTDAAAKPSTRAPVSADSKAKVIRRTAH